MSLKIEKSGTHLSTLLESTKGLKVLISQGDGQCSEYVIITVYFAIICHLR